MRIQEGSHVRHSQKPEIEEAAQTMEAADVCRSEGRYYRLPEELNCKSPEEKYLNAEKIVGRYRHFCETHEFLGESFPNMNVDFGPGIWRRILAQTLYLTMIPFGLNPALTIGMASRPLHSGG